MNSAYNRKIILEDGLELLGYSFGSSQQKVAEIVFNTSMAGYQEILSDLSYTYQAVVMTYPLIGNYGINKDDFESKKPTLSGFIVKEYCQTPSNFRSEKTLGDLMEEYCICGIYGIDTRMLTRHIRNHGSMKVLFCDIDMSLEEGLEILKKTEILKDAVQKVSPKKITTTKPNLYHVVAFDCGMKLNIVRSLEKRGCQVTIVPYNTSVKEVEALKPDGIFLSNGPGDPTDVPELIDTVFKLHGLYPIFGICLGHQIIGLSYGAKTYKLKFGHRGGNHPIKNLKTNKVEMTSQNHSYAIDINSLKNTPLEITHINLLDNTVEGMECVKDRIFSVQYHPESAPGPEDSSYLFDQFISLMKGGNPNA